MSEIAKVKAGFRELVDRVSVHLDQYHIHKLKKELMLGQMRIKLKELGQKHGALDQMPENVRKAYNLLSGNALTLEAEIENTDRLIKALQERINYQSSLIADKATLLTIGQAMQEAYRDLPVLSK